MGGCVCEAERKKTRNSHSLTHLPHAEIIEQFPIEPSPPTIMAVRKSARGSTKRAAAAEVKAEPAAKKAKVSAKKEKPAPTKAKATKVEGVYRTWKMSQPWCS